MKFILFLILGLLFTTVCGVKSPISLPRKVIYIDTTGVNWNDPSQTITSIVDAGYNVIILAFYISNLGPYDMAYTWGTFSGSLQNSTIQYAHDKGAIIMVSLGGSSDIPYVLNPNTLGTTIGEWVVNNNLDGVDFDLENFAPYLTTNDFSSNN
jgi:chitinase